MNKQSCFIFALAAVLISDLVLQRLLCLSHRIINHASTFCSIFQAERKSLSPAAGVLVSKTVAVVKAIRFGQFGVSVISK